MELKCDAGQKIAVKKALYGRKKSNVCPGPKQHNTRCASKKSMSVVKKKCNGKQRCRIPAKNNVFGDPCRGTFKYLEVEYECTGGKTGGKYYPLEKW